MILIEQSKNDKFCMFPRCYISPLTGTVFVFAAGPFIPMWVLFFQLQWEFQWEMTTNSFLALKYVRSILQPYSTAELHFIRDTGHLAIWPSGHLAIRPYATNIGIT